MNIELFETVLKRRGLTQKQLAENIGMNHARITDMKMGRLKGWKYHRKISQALEVPEDDLFPEDGDGRK
jgi:transcriptional regulator with XRE-family HTH domain